MIVQSANLNRNIEPGNDIIIRNLGLLGFVTFLQSLDFREFLWTKCFIFRDKSEKKREKTKYAIVIHKRVT